MSYPYGQYRCPYCGTNQPPFTVSKISSGGWVVFALMLLFCFPAVLDWVVNEGNQPGLPTVQSWFELECDLEAAIGIEPMNKGFADLCLTTWLRRHVSMKKRKDEEFQFSVCSLQP